jgi:hypothetical protein
MDLVFSGLSQKPFSLHPANFPAGAVKMVFFLVESDIVFSSTVFKTVCSSCLLCSSYVLEKMIKSSIDLAEIIRVVAENVVESL